MKIQVQTTPPIRSPRDGLPFGFQKLPVCFSVLCCDINDFLNYIVVLVFLYGVLKRQYLLYCKFAEKDA